jgi:PKD repeat protein
VTVATAGGTPTANFSFTTSGLTANFTDSSTDSGGSISSHSWTFGDGGTSTATSPSHTYAAAGTYSVAETVTDGVSGKTSTKTSSVTVASSGGNVLQNGVGVAISDSVVNHQQNWTMTVPAGATNLLFAMSGGTGDADLYVKFGSAPTLTSYDCRPYITGNNESCPISPAQAGTYYVMVNTYAPYSGATLKGSYTAPGGGGTPTANFTFTTSGLTATFTDSSTDAGGSISAHAWTFGDGGTSTATSPSHAYAAAGTYSATETVTDGVSGKTSSKTSSVTVSGGGGGSTQLLVNPGFEGSSAPWSETAGVDCSTGCSGESAHGGSGFAWLDGYGSAHTDTVSQSVAITAGKTSATLQYYLHIDTAETGTTAYDTLKVQVYSSTGSLLKTLATYSNVNAATGYAVHTNDVSAYIGQTVTIRFTGTEDTSLQTSFVLDDITLTVH